MPPLSDDGPGGQAVARFVAYPELLRAAGRAADPRRIVLAALGMALLWAGWRGIDAALGPQVYGAGSPFAAINLGGKPLDRVSQTRLAELQVEPLNLAAVVAEPSVVVVEPFAHLFERRIELRDWTRWLLRGIWAVVAWGLVGGAIARVAAVREAVGGGVGIASAARFALRRSVALIGAPLTPSIAVTALALGCALFGLVFRLPTAVGGALAGVFGFVPLLIGLVLALILLGLMLAWPLMVATVAVEGEDIGDALSRSFSYVNQRLARYLIHLGLAWGLGIVALSLAIAFARVVLGLADWGVALGAPPTTPSPTSDHFRGFWTDAVSWLVHAYAYSYFWTVVTALFVVLRRDVDGTDPHDVYLPEQALDTFAGPAEPAVTPPTAPGSPA